MPLTSGWILLMAWRSARRNWKRLLFHACAVSIGIGALVAAGSFHHNLQEALRVQAKPLVGADVVVRSRRPFDAEAEALFLSLPYQHLSEAELTTVAFFPEGGGSRLLEVRAVERGFPFYGDVATDPDNVFSAIFDSPGILIERNVMAELGLAPGQTVEIGQAKFRITGALELVPGEAVASIFSAPRAFIDLSRLGSTGLIQEASLARHKRYFKTSQDSDLESLVSLLRSKEESAQWGVSTVADRQRSLGKRLENADRFLKMASLVALLLGGIGVACILYVYAREKRDAAVTLRCLGAPARRTLAVFATEGLFLGAAASVLGGALGLGLQAALPSLLDHFVRIDIPFFIAWSSLIKGIVVGFTLTFLFALLPLLPLRRASPLGAFRMNVDAGEAPLRDPAVWAVGLLTTTLVFLFAKSVIHRATLAAAVPLSMAAAIIVLSLITKLSLVWLRAIVPSTWPAPWRHGLANLFRPHNQTHVLVAALGLGGALVFTVGFLNNSLLRHIALSTGGDQPRLALIDVEKDQVDDLSALLRDRKANVLERAAFVPMRIQGIKGQPLGPDIADWARRREYRSTYRNFVAPSEHLVAGAWPPGSSRNDVVPVSIEEGIAEDLGVSLGDELAFNVQGTVIRAAVTALRRVDWFQLRPNFFVVFPDGVLEEAPQFHVILANAASTEQIGTIQRAVRAAFPNVSTVDLGMVLETLRRYFDKVALALNFMALFVVASAVMVLAGALLASRTERIRETALLRILGAPGHLIRKIHLIEYGLIGLFSAVAGLLLGLLAAFLVSRFLFEIAFSPDPGTAVTGMAALVMLSAATGAFLGRGQLRMPPLGIIRKDQE